MQYAYIFGVIDPKTKKPRLVAIYAESEADARADYLLTYKVDAGKLIRRART